MISRMMGALSARRNSLQEKEKGFTLIELLVVIVIIGILAAIAIPVYLGIQNNAKDSAVKSDLMNAKTAVVAFQTETGNLPAAAALTTDQSTGLGKYGFTLSTPSTTSIVYGAANTATTFCLVGTGSTTHVFYVTDSLGVTGDGTVATKPAGC